MKSAILTGLGLGQTSTEKLCSVTDRNKYKDPKPDIIQRVKNLRTFSPYKVSPSNTSCKVREPSKGGNRKHVRSKEYGSHQEKKAL